MPAHEDMARFSMLGTRALWLVHACAFPEVTQLFGFGLAANEQLFVNLPYFRTLRSSACYPPLSPPMLDKLAGTSVGAITGRNDVVALRREA